MKKIVLLALLAISMLPVYSQTSVGVIAGYNLSGEYPHEKYQLGTWHYPLRQGWRAGLIADHRLWKKFYLQPQLLLNAKGQKVDYHYYYSSSNGEVASKSITRTLYLELQANLIFKEPVGSGKLLVGAGPYLGRGIHGKFKIDSYADTDNGRYYSAGENPIKFRNKLGSEAGVAYQKPYDAGINFQAGYEFKNGLLLNAVYSLGLTKLGYSNDIKPKNTYFGLSVGYFLKKFS